MLPQWIIEKKRDGQELTNEEITFFINKYNAGEIPDYQMSALAMAIYIRGMSFKEVTILTEVMMNSGDILDISSIKNPTSDKHSTGGIGDKVSLILAPLAACAGIAVPMISGRGLGITGGTLDKFDSIPGYRTNLSNKEFLNVINQCGCSIIGQTANLAPVDKKLYALRDVTGTVSSIPLISASIMSKKLAENSSTLVLDVKWGTGAFMKTKEQAKELAKTMVEIGTRMKKGMTAIITDMNQPLGKTVGNSLEVIESIETLKGNGPLDLTNESLELTAHMLILTKKANTISEAIEILQKHIDTGAAYEKFKQMVKLHGGDVRAIDNTEILPKASIIKNYISDKNGYVSQADAEKIGKASCILGAGRQTVESKIDYAVGFTNIKKIGEQVNKGDTLLTIHVNDKNKLKECEDILSKAFNISGTKPEKPVLIVETIK